MSKLYKETYFQHDRYARQDPKIRALLAHFRKESEETAKSAMCVYWWIVEDMHTDSYPADNLEAFADDYRCSVEFLKSILEDFGLFRQENGCYISDRILRNLQEQQNKINLKQGAANSRWLVKMFIDCYGKEFGKPPVLEDEDIKALKKYNSSIPELKELLPDILYTLKNLKFDTDINFKPSANWLLSKKNLSRLLNGEFGQLKHRKTEKELKAEEEQRAEEEQKRNQPGEFELQIERISGKAEALDFIAQYCRDTKLKTEGNRIFLIPDLKKLTKKFDITNEEIIDKCRQ
ncbi:MAG: DUF4373 domain-containing protein [Candidatus Gastranaerophilales bacterium]|nr:DUF4373 domain-containing protein [Candidatus Gastranaerophilales bacterium]